MERADIGIVVKAVVVVGVEITEVVDGGNDQPMVSLISLPG